MSLDALRQVCSLRVLRKLLPEVQLEATFLSHWQCWQKDLTSLETSLHTKPIRSYHCHARFSIMCRSTRIQVICAKSAAFLQTNISSSMKQLSTFDAMDRVTSPNWADLALKGTHWPSLDSLSIAHPRKACNLSYLLAGPHLKFRGCSSCFAFDLGPAFWQYCM